MSVLRALLARVWGFVQVLGNASQFHSAGYYKPVISNDDSTCLAINEPHG